MLEPAMTEEDAAWASINTHFPVTELKDFCRDTERLFRINPMLEFYQWRALDTQRYFFSGKNISQETPFDFEFELTVKELADGFRIDYDRGIKSSTEFKIEATEQGSKLTITDRYEAMPEEDRQQYLDTVDKSLVNWASYLQRYLTTWQKWSTFGPWRWYMRRVWQPMKPSGRRITYMLLWITLVEVALIILGVGIYFAEYA
ncbi:MAG: hypothetical protein OEZ38_13155 [Gammaproteobacteria bacterium]|nr:hypothetical protein [Gammaproteobacteria bacterium]